MKPQIIKEKYDFIEEVIQETLVNKAPRKRRRRIK